MPFQNQDRFSEKSGREKNQSLSYFYFLTSWHSKQLLNAEICNLIAYYSSTTLIGRCLRRGQEKKLGKKFWNDQHFLKKLRVDVELGTGLCQIWPCGDKNTKLTFASTVAVSDSCFCTMQKGFRFFLECEI